MPCKQIRQTIGVDGRALTHYLRDANTVEAELRDGSSRQWTFLWRVDETRHICLYRRVNSSQFRRYLARQGCTFEEGKKHTLVYRDGKVAALPRHGGSKQLGTGLINAIKKALEIE